MTAKDWGLFVVIILVGLVLFIVIVGSIWHYIQREIAWHEWNKTNETNTRHK